MANEVREESGKKKNFHGHQERRVFKEGENSQHCPKMLSVQTRWEQRVATGFASMILLSHLDKIQVSQLVRSEAWREQVEENLRSEDIEAMCVDSSWKVWIRLSEKWDSGWRASEVKEGKLPRLITDIYREWTLSSVMFTSEIFISVAKAQIGDVFCPLKGSMNCRGSVSCLTWTFLLKFSPCPAIILRFQPQENILQVPQPISK